MTPRIRLYSSDCGQPELVLQGIKDAGNIDMSVWLGIFFDGEEEVYKRQLDNVIAAIKKHGTDHISGITVGNEFLLAAYHAGGKANDPKILAAQSNLLKYVQETKKSIEMMQLKKVIPIGTSDAPFTINKEICAGVDYIMANVHPWFANLPVEKASDWTWQYFQDSVVDICSQASNNPTVYIGEAGWPTSSDDPKAAKSGNMAASTENLQKFMDSFVCQANSNGTDYFFFEFKDEPWKRTEIESLLDSLSKHIGHVFHKE
ncbi:glycoside hydrolase superfamily [Phakopsora pachyrhizi]|uniref:glucan endo-1,3-beta-D-glucosidase n=1 Tax=Phakopsora pachyrhizi TaxID=170000 RepID=A0AAV0AME1_PHAPC|nr:glycoside hydrolase superfamily [Phakopsora pachyrhizi]